VDNPERSDGAVPFMGITLSEAMEQSSHEDKLRSTYIITGSMLTYPKIIVVSFYEK